MGLLDRFKKSKENVENNAYETQQPMQLPFNVEFTPMSNGNMQIDFYDKNFDFNKFYDTTRLVVSAQPLNIEGHQVYNCAVSWYGENDCQTLNPQTGKYESGRAQRYRGVLAEIDLNLLQSDPNYCSAVMKGLLDQQRVEKYLQNGLEESPEQPCGKYIGGIMQKGNRYGKFFSETVGKASHNSTIMVNRRKENREKAEAQKQRDIADKKAQIEKLQNEIDDMER